MVNGNRPQSQKYGQNRNLHQSLKYGKNSMFWPTIEATYNNIILSFDPDNYIIFRPQTNLYRGFESYIE